MANKKTPQVLEGTPSYLEQVITALVYRVKENRPELAKALKSKQDTKYFMMLHKVVFFNHAKELAIVSDNMLAKHDDGLNPDEKLEFDINTILKRVRVRKLLDKMVSAIGSMWVNFKMHEDADTIDGLAAVYGEKFDVDFDEALELMKSLYQSAHPLVENAKQPTPDTPDTTDTTDTTEDTSDTPDTSEPTQDTTPDTSEPTQDTTPDTTPDTSQPEQSTDSNFKPLPKKKPKTRKRKGSQPETSNQEEDSDLPF